MTEKISVESVLEEIKRNLGEEAVEGILSEQEPGYSGRAGAIMQNATKDPSDMSLGIKIGGRRVAPGNAPALDPEKQARIEKTGEIGMALTPLGRGVGVAAQGAKNFGANIVKGFTGSSRNVTRDLGGSGRFAAPGLGSKAGEAAGKAAANPTVQKGAAAAGVAAGVGVAAATADKDEKPNSMAALNAGARKDMPGFKPKPEPSADDLYKDKGSQANAPETKSEPSAPVPNKGPQPPISTKVEPTKPVSPPARPARPATPTEPAKPQAPTTSATGPSGDESNAEYWNREAERNRAQGGKPLPNEFNLFKEEKNFDQFVKKFIKENR